MPSRPKATIVPDHVRGVRLVAMLEIAKAVVALLAAFGLLWAVHAGAARLVDELASHLHLNPAGRAPHVLADVAQDLTNAHLRLLSIGVLVYVATRLIEGWGLWYGRRWAVWFSVASGAIYLPFEVYELARGVSLLTVCALLVNLAVVAYMARVLWSPRPRQET
jgi:uncharacterized membrane protein (DUF2068 family)